MLAAEKQKIMDFLDLTDDFLGSGYKSGRNTENFKEDAPETIEKISEEIRICKNCQLGNLRKNAVPGEGSLNPLVMVIGEGPGMDEDDQGRPFVGKAGHLLDKMLASIGLSRNSNAFIANVVKCRPPGNRDPYPEEASACSGFLERQILLLKPKFILAAGRISAQTLLKTAEPIGKLRGSFTDFKAGGLTFPLFVIYHPAAVLRNDSLRRPVWEDLKILRSRMEEQYGGELKIEGV